MGGRQAGFVHSSILDLVFLFVLILLAVGVWSWLSTLLGGDFTLAWFMVWLMAAAAGWWFGKDQLVILRLPAGLLVFIAASLLLMPLSWWSESKLVTGTEAAVAAVSAPYLGKLWSRRLASKLQPTPPWYLRQSINLINDIFHWAFVSAVAWFLVGVLPLLSVFVVPVEWVPWAARVWAFAAMAWYLAKYHPRHMRILKLPLGLWGMAAATFVLGFFQQRFVGTLEPGSVSVLAYGVYLPAVIGLAVEIICLGTPGKARGAMAARSAELT